ncbi:hypothetical protein QJQ45_026630 [Haematococcus lacustris]|nr:hypothetical protein QJQ45_026630 [Haematococcus lacustris]
MAMASHKKEQRALLLRCALAYATVRLARSGLLTAGLRRLHKMTTSALKVALKGSSSGFVKRKRARAGLPDVERQPHSVPPPPAAGPQEHLTAEGPTQPRAAPLASLPAPAATATQAVQQRRVVLISRPQPPKPCKTPSALCQSSSHTNLHAHSQAREVVGVPEGASTVRSVPATPPALQSATGQPGFPPADAGPSSRPADPATRLPSPSPTQPLLSLAAVGRSSLTAGDALGLPGSRSAAEPQPSAPSRLQRNARRTSSSSDTSAASQEPLQPPGSEVSPREGSSEEKEGGGQAGPSKTRAAQLPRKPQLPREAQLLPGGVHAATGRARRKRPAQLQHSHARRQVAGAGPEPGLDAAAAGASTRLSDESQPDLAQAAEAVSSQAVEPLPDEGSLARVPVQLLAATEGSIGSSLGITLDGFAEEGREEASALVRQGSSALPGTDQSTPQPIPASQHVRCALLEEAAAGSSRQAAQQPAAQQQPIAPQLDGSHHLAIHRSAAMDPTPPHQAAQEAAQQLPSLPAPQAAPADARVQVGAGGQAALPSPLCPSPAADHHLAPLPCQPDVPSQPACVAQDQAHAAQLALQAASAPLPSSPLEEPWTPGVRGKLSSGDGGAGGEGGGGQGGGSSAGWVAQLPPLPADLLPTAQSTGQLPPSSPEQPAPLQGVGQQGPLPAEPLVLPRWRLDVSSVPQEPPPPDLCQLSAAGQGAAGSGLPTTSPLLQPQVVDQPTCGHPALPVTAAAAAVTVTVLPGAQPGGCSGAAGQGAQEAVQQAPLPPWPQSNVPQLASGQQGVAAERVRQWVDQQPSQLSQPATFEQSAPAQLPTTTTTTAAAAAPAAAMTPQPAAAEAQPQAQAFGSEVGWDGEESSAAAVLRAQEAGSMSECRIARAAGSAGEEQAAGLEAARLEAAGLQAGGESGRLEVEADVPGGAEEEVEELVPCSTGEVLGLPACVGERLLAAMDADGLRVLRAVSRSMYFDASRAMRTLVVTPDNLEVLLAMPLHSLCPHLHTLVFRGPLPGSAQPSSSSSSSLGPSVFAHATPCPQPPNNNLARPAQPGLHPAAAQAAIMTLQAAAMPGFPYLADQLTALVAAAPPPAPAPQPLTPITAATPPAAPPGPAAPAVPPPFAPFNIWGTAAAQPAVATLTRQLGHPTSASTPDLTTEQSGPGSTADVIEPAAGPSAAVAGVGAAAAAGAEAAGAGAGSVGLEAAAAGPAAPPQPGFHAGSGLSAGRDAGLGMLAALPQGLPEPGARPRSAAQGQAAAAGAADSGPGFDLSMVEQFARDVLPHLHGVRVVDISESALHTHSSVWAALVAGAPHPGTHWLLKEPSAWARGAQGVLGAVDPPRDTKDHYPALYDALQTIDARNLRQARMALAAAQAQLARLMGHAARPPPPVTPAAELGAAVQPAGAPAPVHEPGLEATGEAAGEEAGGGGPAVAAVIGIHAAVPGAEGGSQAPQPPLPVHTHHSPIASTLPSPPLPHMTAELLGVTVRRHTASRLPALCALRCLTSLTLFGKSAAAQPHGHRLASHLSALAGLPQLRRLELWSYEDISDVELAPLAACTRLEHLYVDSLFIKQAVGPVFPSLTSLTMARIKFILRPLTAIFPSLDRLRLGVLQSELNKKISSASLSCLAGCGPQLTRLCVCPVLWKGQWQVLPTLLGLTHLQLVHCRDLSHLREVLRVVGQMPALTHLELHAASCAVAPWPGASADPDTAGGGGPASSPTATIAAAVAAAAQAAAQVAAAGGVDAAGVAAAAAAAASLVEEVWEPPNSVTDFNLFAGLAGVSQLRSLRLVDCSARLVRHLAGCSLPGLRCLAVCRLGRTLRLPDLQAVVLSFPTLNDLVLEDSGDFGPGAALGLPAVLSRPALQVLWRSSCDAPSLFHSRDCGLND